MVTANGLGVGNERKELSKYFGLNNRKNGSAIY